MAYIAYVVPVQARWIQIIVTRDLAARLARRQPSVDLGPLDVLAGTAFSRHSTQLLRYRSTSQIEPGVFAPGSLPRRGTHKYPNVTLPTRRAFLLGRLSVNYELIGILPGFGRPNRFGT